MKPPANAIWYKAWWLFAPVWVADPLGECWVKPRPAYLGAPLYWLVEWVVLGLLIPLTCLVRPDWEPVFAFHITDKRWRGQRQERWP